MKKFEINERSLVSVLSYLKSKPYKEVVSIIQLLESDIRDSVEKEKESIEVDTEE